MCVNWGRAISKEPVHFVWSSYRRLSDYIQKYSPPPPLHTYSPEVFFFSHVTLWHSTPTGFLIFKINSFILQKINIVKYHCVHSYTNIISSEHVSCICDPNCTLTGFNLKKKGNHDDAQAFPAFHPYSSKWKITILIGSCKVTERFILT